MSIPWFILSGKYSFCKAFKQFSVDTCSLLENKSVPIMAKFKVIKNSIKWTFCSKYTHTQKEFFLILYMNLYPNNKNFTRTEGSSLFSNCINCSHNSDHNRLNKYFRHRIHLHEYISMPFIRKLLIRNENRLFLDALSHIFSFFLEKKKKAIILIVAFPPSLHHFTCVLIENHFA